MRFTSFIVTTMFAFSGNLLLAFGQPGDKAAYSLDSSRQRTSALIVKGNFDVNILEHLPKHPQGDSYKFGYNYQLSLMFAGDRNGNGTFDILAQYLSPEFLEKVKQNEVISTENFKIKYLGSEDVTTKHGKYYEKCDLVLIYDINLQGLTGEGISGNFLEALIPPPAPGSNQGPIKLAEIEQLTIKSAVKHGMVPVFGAARIDISALVRGMRVHAGFDYDAPANQ